MNIENKKKTKKNCEIIISYVDHEINQSHVHIHVDNHRFTLHVTMQ